ncbi:MAG: enoyl-CoA hydratase/isomerase family protein, partial [Melioribacteraceae bacterium]|nr:enoyl-CoA hydratase/isomerase family protein [Melioribacteraceae bacterium]
KESMNGSNIELTNRTRRTRQLIILNKLIKKIVNFPKLVVVALNGEIVTPFFGASLAADIRIAADNVNFLLSHTKRNIHPSGALPYFLPKYIGHGKASNILLGRDAISSDEALELGLLSLILPENNFEESALEEVNNRTKSFNNAYNCSKVLLNSNYSDLEKYLSFEECEFKQI